MAPITAKQVVKFLEKNPDFFLENPDLVGSTGLLREKDSGPNLVDIRTRLFERLNEERIELMGILDETIELVRQNEQIETDFLAIENLLFGSQPPGDVLSQVAEEIERRFELDHVSFLLSEKAKGALPGEVDEAGRVRPYPESGEPPPRKVKLAGMLKKGADDLFPEKARTDLHSTALVPLRENGKSLGVMLLGSKDPKRYAPKMGTQLLERLAVRMATGIHLLLRLTGEGPAVGSKPNSKQGSKKNTKPKSKQGPKSKKRKSARSSS